MLLRVLILAALLVAAADAWATSEIVKEDPGHPRMCKDKTTRKFYASGATWSHPNECSKYSCDFPRLNAEGCGVEQPPKGCTMVEDHTKRYPHCCPKPSCG